MTNVSLAQSYLIKAEKRLKILPILVADGAFSDVVREAQEVVDLALKGMLRQVGIEPPKWHDVGSHLQEFAERFPGVARSELDRLAAISGWLRKEREFAFYGDIDFIPTEEYTAGDGQRAIDDATVVVTVARRVVPPASN